MNDRVQAYQAGRKTRGPERFGAFAKGLLLGAVLVAVAVIAGCADYPIAIRVDSSKGGLSYSSKDGLAVDIHSLK